MKNFNFNLLAGLLSIFLAVNISAQFSLTTPPSGTSLTNIQSNRGDNISPNHPKSHLSVINVTIIESQSFNSGHVMDTVWRYVAQGLGYNAV